MHIGYDAKRYFHNATGLGNYSRTLVNSLAQHYSQHAYILFNPKPAAKFALQDGLPLQEVLPQNFFYKKFPSLWRSKAVTGEFAVNKLDLYHGLSHEIPVGIKETGVPSIVSVHDLIFERYPEQYGPYEVRMHRKKIQYACRHADAIIAISWQTADDLVTRYGVPAEKIEVCYQSCDPAFFEEQPDEKKAALRQVYHLPEAFFLYVGSITERKNLLGICAAIKEARTKLHLPLVVVGKGKAYREKVVAFLQANGLRQKVIFLADAEPHLAEHKLDHVANLAALYQMATALVYPSYFEGFGIPVLEALASGVPVITSTTASMPEVGGKAAMYVAPNDHKALADALVQVQNDGTLRNDMIKKGKEHAQQFTLAQTTKAVMDLYQKIVR